MGHMLSTSRLTVLFGPSGVGKDSVIEVIRRRMVPWLRLSVSMTTRRRRSYEVDGIHYHFVD
jgi:guanylate kinase